jgi:hypothetical protein
MDDYNDNAANANDQGARTAGDVTTDPNAESGREGRPEESMGQPVPGAPVYDSTGMKVGSVSSINLSNEYFTLEKGVLFTRDFYVPLSAVERTEPDAVYLNVDKDQMAYLGWDARPNDETIDSASSLSVEDEDRQS